MKFGYRLDKTQAQSVARRRSAFVQSVEAPEDKLALLFRYAYSRVGDTGAIKVRFIRERQGNRGIAGTMGYRVFYEVDEELGEQFSVAIDPSVG
uniref:Uncharacterized protein n=1 Tax=Rhizobium rhizogenes TaxID=359 RepID=A0A7S4ZT74_RHIRH|nr:hypothetical protein pC6.5d_709 [Rhizobium rhizogenes]